MNKRLSKDLIVLCAGLAGLTVGQLMAERIARQSPDTPSAISAARLASAMALARRMRRFLPRRESSPSVEAGIAFAAGLASVVATPVLSRLVRGKPSGRVRASSR